MRRKSDLTREERVERAFVYNVLKDVYSLICTRDVARECEGKTSMYAAEKALLLDWISKTYEGDMQ